jgi:hypothetical protein
VYQTSLALVELVQSGLHQTSPVLAVLRPKSDDSTQMTKTRLGKIGIGLSTP